MILEKLLDNKEDFKKIIYIPIILLFWMPRILISIELMILIKIRLIWMFKEIFFKDLLGEYKQA